MIEVSNENRHFRKMAEDKLDKASSQAVGAIQNFTSCAHLKLFIIKNFIFIVFGKYLIDQIRHFIFIHFSVKRETCFFLYNLSNY